jgi:hypothetical protein
MGFLGVTDFSGFTTLGALDGFGVLVHADAFELMLALANTLTKQGFASEVERVVSVRDAIELWVIFHAYIVSEKRKNVKHFFRCGACRIRL